MEPPRSDFHCDFHCQVEGRRAESRRKSRPRGLRTWGGRGAEVTGASFMRDWPLGWASLVG